MLDLGVPTLILDGSAYDTFVIILDKPFKGELSALLPYDVWQLYNSGGLSYSTPN